jgi:hypothetical protein
VLTCNIVVLNALHMLLQEPELLETLYVTQQMAPEAAELALESALRTLSNAISNNGSSAGAARPDSAVTSAISSLQEASHKYAQVCWKKDVRHTLLRACCGNSSWQSIGSCVACRSSLSNPFIACQHVIPS